MPKAAPKNPADYILPLYMNGLNGRMLYMPAPKGTSRELLFVYGHHSSLERIFGAADYLNQYGAVTVPDLPGFGGMESFYKIGEKPTLDNMADYLASFIKLRFKNKKFSIAGLSLGFMIVTRMLQKYPEIAKQTDLVVSMAGLTHKDDFRFSKRNFITLRAGAWVLSRKFPAAFVQHVIFRRSLIKLGYGVLEPIFIKGQDTKLRKADDEERRKRLDFEVHLWQCNDVRTYASTAVDMFTLDLTKHRANVPVHHVSMDNDRYFDSILVEQHMRKIYTDFYLHVASVPEHMPSVIATAEQSAPFVPESLKKILRKQPA